MARRRELRFAAVLLAVATMWLTGCAGDRHFTSALNNELRGTPKQEPKPPSTPIQQAAATSPALPLPTIPTPPTLPTVPSEALPAPQPTAVNPGPFKRSSPTVVGSALQLAPNEQPIEKAVEVAKRVDELLADNAILLSRIRQLEAQAEAREQAIKEAVRDADIYAEQAKKKEAEVAALRREVQALKEKARREVQSEIEFLRSIIDALRALP